MNTKLKTLHEINSEAIHVLCKELGITNTIRFINQYHTGLGNYTQQRADLFGDLTINELILKIRKGTISKKD